jgi:hypothetical protein
MPSCYRIVGRLRPVGRMIASDVVLTNTTGRLAEAAALDRRHSMGQAIPRQHPAVALRTHFNQLRALLAVAMVAVVGLTIAVVILATDSNGVSSTSSATPVESIDYGDSNRVNPSTGYPSSLSTRPDGGPEEGTADVTSSQPRVIKPQASGPPSDYAHGPLPPALPAKDYGMNGATGDYATESQPGFGSRADGGPDEGLHLRSGTN